MAIPLIPFVAGAVIGGLAAYLYRDDRLRRRVRTAAGDLSDKARDTADSIGDTLSGVYGDLRDKVMKKDAVEPGTDAEPVVETGPPKKATKKTAARKKVTKKKAAAKPAAEDAKPDDAGD